MGCYMAYILAYFNSASRWHNEVLASQFPFVYSIEDSITPSQASLYRCINWSLTQAHHQSSLGLSKSSPSMKGARAMPKAP